MKDRHETARQILRDAAAQWLAREAGPQSLITITRAEVSSDFRNATLFLSVLPEEKSEAALGLARRNIPELKKFLKEHTKLPRAPYIDFTLEREEKLSLSSEAREKK